MKFNVIALLIFFFSVFISCQKEDDPNTIDIEKERLENISKQFNISCKCTGMDLVKIKLDIDQGGVTYTSNDYIKMEWKKNGSTTIAGSKILKLDEMEAVVTGFEPQTDYQLLFSFCNTEGASTDKQVIDVKTRSFAINYIKVYPEFHTVDYGQVSFYSLEGATHTFYGKGFTNSPLKFKFVSRTNESDQFTITPVVINDSVLTITIPKEIVPNDPYVLFKSYAATLNGYTIATPRYAYSITINNGTVYEDSDETVDFDIFNQDFLIQDVQVEYKENKTNPEISIIGRFGVPAHFNEETTPEFYWGVLMNPKKTRQLHVRKVSDGTIKKFNLAEWEHGKMSYNENNEYRGTRHYNLSSNAGFGDLNLNLPTGNYAVKYYSEGSDGSVKTSNEFPFSIK